jgi:predicted PurR-regulated permease PerM
MGAGAEQGLAPDPGRRDPLVTLFSRRVVRVVLIVLVALAAVVLVRRAGEVLLVLFAGILLALFLSGVARFLSARLPLPYGLWLAATILAMLGGAAGAVTWLAPRVIDQVAILIDQVPAAARSVVGAERLSQWLHAASHGGGQGIVHEVEGALATATGLLSRGAKIVGGIVVFAFLGIYGAAQPAVYKRGLLTLVPPRGRPRAAQVVDRTATSLRRWLFGRVVAMVFVGAATSITFAILGLPVALGLGLFAGLLSFIEYIGAILSAVPALLLAANQGLGTVLWVLVLFTGVHAVEGYLLTPLLARRTVRFPPGFTLAVQLVMGLFFGLLGLMLATPVTVVVTIAVQMLYVEDVLGDRP